ncbi:MAG: ABC transporter permease subunit [Candidatus Nanopelagicales bacterium]|nr:ABC transporter permease subunit [Candidatus Nanopelagicales bacterium]
MRLLPEGSIGSLRRWRNTPCSRSNPSAANSMKFSSTSIRMTATHRRLVSRPMSLLVSDLRLRWRSLLWWTVGVVLLSTLVSSFYKSIAGDTAYEEVFSSLPESLQGLIGGADLGTPVGYLSAEMYSFFMPAVLLVFAIGRSTSTLAGEEEDHTLDLLLAQPISRTALYVQKVVGVALGIAVLAIAVAVPVIALADWSELKVPAANLWAATAQLFAFVLFLGMLAMTVSASMGRRAAGVGVAAGLAFVTYLLDGFGKSIEWLEPWRVLTPWYWYDVGEALAESMPWTSFAVLLGATLIVGALGLWGFNRRNLRS